MIWQDIIVAIVCIVVVVAAIYRVWHFFRCRDKSGCASCNKECGMRRE